MEDERIIDLYFCRSELAIAETERKYGANCYKLSVKIVMSPEDAQECVNDSYMQTWNSIPPTRPVCFSAYLYKIVRNASLNKLKMENAQKRGSSQYRIAFEEVSESLSSGDNVAAQVDLLFLQKLLQKWLSKLSFDQRNIFIGRYWFFDSISEISKKTGFSESKIKMILFRLRKDLQTVLEREGIEL